jgi:hypothetical protein
MVRVGDHADVQRQLERARRRTRASRARDSLALTVLLLALLGVTGASLAAGPIWQPDAPTRAPFCQPGEIPRFEFGFAELARHLGNLMGEPTECEHGDDWSSDTLQQTTTGTAVYRWCTNTPTFARGSERWMLTAMGLERWTDEGPSPAPQVVVRAPDLRRPCSP